MKPTYQKPTIEIIEVENEGIIAASNDRMPNRDWPSEVINPGEIEPVTPIDRDNKA